MDAACFQHDSAYAKYKNRLNRRQSNVVLKNTALKIAMDPRINRYQRGLASMVYKFFNERTKGSGINNEILTKDQLLKTLKEEKFILVLKIIFGVMIWLICH